MRHPNKLPFMGVLAYVDTPSDVAPSGARGHCVVLTRRAAVQALHTLVGMAIDYKPDWDGHDAQRKIGVIETAELSGKAILVTGYVYCRDLPAVVRTIHAQAEPLGMSYELADARIEDLRAEVWRMTRVTFTGAAVLLQEKAAYKRTEFILVEDD